MTSTAAVLLLVWSHYQCLVTSTVTLTQWELAPRSSVGAVTGATLSLPGAQWPHGMVPVNVNVPCTVLACLVQNTTWDRLYFGQRLAQVNVSQFLGPWLYRARVALSRVNTIDALTLRFMGINYRADIFVDGELIGSRRALVGPFRYFDVPVPVPPTGRDFFTVVVEVYPPHDNCFPPGNNSTDLAITFVDWAFHPPDANMGLWREVELITSSGGPSVLLHGPLVSTQLMGDNSPQGNNITARVGVAVNIRNLINTTIKGFVTVVLPQTVTSPPLPGDVNQNVEVVLQPYDDLTVSFPPVFILHPVLWWPWQMGKPHLHNVTVSFVEISGPGGARAHRSKPLSLRASVGLRQVESIMTVGSNSLSAPSKFAMASRLFKVNGQRILIRGGGYSPDLLLRHNTSRDQSLWLMMRWAGLNALRLEGKMPPDEFFAMADRLGMLVLPGWCCCDAWQHWSAWGPEQYAIAGASLKTQLTRLRSHPSVVVFLYGSDESPPSAVERMFLQVFHQTLWFNVSTALASAANTSSNITGRTGVKMSGPYAWVPPVYWSDPVNMKYRLGGAFSFLTEGGPGASPMVWQSVVRTIPANQSWPVENNPAWDFHCGFAGGLFGSFKYFLPSLRARYGKSSSGRQFVSKAQVATYEAQRAMFEAYSRAKYQATGVIQWMANNAFPQHIWNLVDYFFNTGGSFFGAQKACRGLSLSLDPYDDSIWLVSSTYEEKSAPLMMLVQIVSLNGTIVWEHVWAVPGPSADSSVRVGQVPQTLQLPAPMYIVRLKYQSSSVYGSEFVNDYWRSSAQKDVLDWENSNFYRTPCSQFADFTALNSLPRADVEATAVLVESPLKFSRWLYEALVRPVTWSVLVNNTSVDALAFFVRVDVVRLSDGTSVSPVFWTDNSILLLPMETRELKATFECPSTFGCDPQNSKLGLSLSTYNQFSS